MAEIKEDEEIAHDTISLEEVRNRLINDINKIEISGNALIRIPQ